MKTSKLITAFLIGMITLHNVNAQDSVKIRKPVFFSADLTLGIKNQGAYVNGILRLYRETGYVSLGVSVFDYVPKDLPGDYYSILFNAVEPENALNSNTLLLIGIGEFIPSAHKTFRVLLQADAAFGKYEEAVNFKSATFTFFGPTYEYETVKGFTGGLHLLAKAEVCSRFASLGLSLETFVTTKATAFGAGLSFGLGKLRKRNY